MTIMSFLLLIILFLAFFIYFSGLNPQEITIFYLPDQSITYSVALVVVACVLGGLLLGYLVHLYGTASHLIRHWKRDRNEKRAREVSAIYREGVGRLLSGDIKKAHALLQRALERDPSRVETHIAMASVHLQEGESADGLGLLLKARSLDARSLEVLFKLAATYEEMGRDADAAQVYQDILILESGNRKALRSLRDLQIKKGSWPEAMELQKRIIKAGPGTQRLAEEKKNLLCLRYEVARAALDQGDFEEAKSEFKDIIREAPEFVPARVSLGDACRLQKRWEDAAGIWQEGYQTLGKGIFLSRIEDLFLEAEDPSTLLSFYNAALLERGDDLMLRLFYGKLCLRLEMVDEALEQLYTVESAGIDFPELHLLLAEAHRRRSRTDEAIGEYQKALGAANRLRLDYNCEGCGASAPAWQSRCGECGRWGTLSLAVRKQLRSAKPPELRAYHHGEREEWNED